MQTEIPRLQQVVADLAAAADWASAAADWASAEAKSAVMYRHTADIPSMFHHSKISGR